MAHKAPSIEFSNKKDLDGRYQLWKQRLGFFSQTSSKTGKHLVPYMLEGLDDEGLKIFNSFGLTAAEKEDPKNIYDKFEERLNICKPNFRAARLDLHFYYQNKTETLDDFYTRCKNICSTCAFQPAEEKERIIEQILASTPIPEYQRWLLDQDDTVTMDVVLYEGKKYETNLHTLNT